MNIVTKAKIFATAAHYAVGQLRKYTNEPYIVHPAEVAGLVELYTKNDTLIAAAWLHDVVEDTCITNKIIQEEFGDEIATLVHYLTDVSVESDGNRAKRKAIDLAHTMTASNDAKTIKLSDIISNVKSIKEHDAEFANVYLPEKRAQLQVLIGGNSDLYIIAQKLLEE